MPRRKPDRPTDVEMAILRLLWKRDGMTAKAVHLKLESKRSAAYTTTLTKLQFMHKKGLVTRDESQKSHVYRAVKTQEQTERSLVRSLVNKTFAGSARNLVLYAMSLEKVSPEELARIEKLFDDPDET